TGGYDPNTSAADSRLIQAQVKVYERSGIKPILWPRLAGSWPGYVFTGAPLKLPAGHFGLCHGSRAHAPDEYFLIEPSDSKLFGFDAAVRSFVDYLHELAYPTTHQAAPHLALSLTSSSASCLRNRALSSAGISG